MCVRIWVDYECVSFIIIIIICTIINGVQLPAGRPSGKLARRRIRKRMESALMRCMQVRSHNTSDIARVIINQCIAAAYARAAALRHRRCFSGLDGAMWRS